MEVRPTIFALFVVFVLTGSTSFFCSSRTGTVGVVSIGKSSNRAPEASDSTLTALVNEITSGFMEASDPDGDELIYSIVESPSLGVVSVTDTRSGAFDYISSASGSDRFSFKANDGKADSNVASVDITIVDQQVAWEAVTADIAMFVRRIDIEVSMCLQNDVERNLGVPNSVNIAGKGSSMTSYCSVADPFDPGHLLSVHYGCSLIQSYDGGLTWNTIDLAGLIAKPCQRLIVDFNHFIPGLIYLGINYFKDGARLIRSTDGALNWQLISSEMPGHLIALQSGALNLAGKIILLAAFSDLEHLYQGKDTPFFD